MNKKTMELLIEAFANADRRGKMPAVYREILAKFTIEDLMEHE